MSVLLAILSANETTGLLFLYIPFFIWLIFRKTAWSTIVFTVIASLFFFVYTTEKLDVPKELPQQMILKWTSTVKVNGGRVRGLMEDVNGQKIYVVYTIQHEEEKKMLEQQTLAKQTFHVEGELKPVTKPHHAYAFDFQDYLKSHHAIGIYEVTKWQPLKVNVPFTAFLWQQRVKLEQHIDKTFPKALQAEAKALLIGQQDDVEAVDTRAYQKLGITHLFAISGLHVALMSLLFQQVLLRMGVRKEHVFYTLWIALPTYAILAGGAPSVWRSVIMVLILYGALLFNHRLKVESALGLCFLLFVLIEPNIIYQVGFQLSFLATSAIVLSSEYLARCKNWLTQSLWITISCQLLVLPLLLSHFYEVSTASIVMNLIFVPLFSFVILPANLVLLCSSFLPPFVSPLLFSLYEPFRVFVQDFIYLCQKIPYQMWNPGKPAIWMLCFLFLAILFFFYTMEQKRYRLVSIGIFFSFTFYITEQPKHHEDVRVTFLSVDQGDCTIIELPNRRGVYMIDSGGLLRFGGTTWKQSDKVYEIGRQIIVPYLKGRGIQKIDRLILTHADADHVEGAEEVMQEVKVKEIHITPSSAQKAVMQDVLHEAEKQHIPIQEQMAGAAWQQGAFRMEYVMPYDTVYEGNNDSIVIVLTYEGKKIIIPGDLEAAGEAELVEKNPDALKGTTILKAGHHGSKTSTSDLFLQAVKPQLVIYSSGRNNRYNHPAKEVVERVQQAHIEALNTAEVGTIEVRMTKTTIDLQP